MVVGGFSKGALVEVSSDEEGFRGAWFTATIIRAVGKKRFLVEYQSLMADDDETKPLRETVDALHIRPFPPQTQQELTMEKFDFLEEVDAFINDGWWVGVISRVLGSGGGSGSYRYRVYFRYSKEEMEFEHSELRVHQERIDGKWFRASEALKL